eukprot:12003645-Ditylum_brightwellii.AAC.1
MTGKAENLNVIKWLVDGAFGVHEDIKSHTGTTMTLGKGSVYIMSTKQKINTKSSTETKLAGVNDALPMIIWTPYFIEAQGYDVDRSI